MHSLSAIKHMNSPKGLEERRQAKLKTYHYDFVVDGHWDGWNSERALNKEQAIKQAKERWKDSPLLLDYIDESSFRVISEAEERQLLSYFN